MLVLLDTVMYTLHVLVIVFNLTGWIWRPLRRWHLYLFSMTLFSWLGLGPWYGWGYCFLTDWHWDIKRQLGETGLPNSFIQYLLNDAGIATDATMTDWLTGVSFCLALIATIWVNWIDRKKSNISGAKD